MRPSIFQSKNLFGQHANGMINFTKLDSGFKSEKSSAIFTTNYSFHQVKIAP